MGYPHPSNPTLTRRSQPDAIGAARAIVQEGDLLELDRRRTALAYLASVERLSAMLLTERAQTPALKNVGTWVSDQLEEIESVLLAHAHQEQGAAREQWLNVAERFLVFYVGELRRLEDLAPPTRHLGLMRNAALADPAGGRPRGAAALS